MAAVRFRFTCTQKAEYQNSNAPFTLSFEPVKGEPFGTATPSANFCVSTTAEAAKQFKVGKVYEFTAREVVQDSTLESA